MKLNTIIRMLYKLSVIGLLLFSIVSCSENDQLQYDINQKDGVYFLASKSTDSIFYNFGFDEITELKVEIPVHLMGLPVNYDREFKISLSNERYVDSTVVPAIEQYYEMPNTIVMAADSVSTTIPITLKRHEDLEELRAILTLNLEPTTDLDIRGHSEFTITFDDKAPLTPAWWTSYDYGNFTKLKGQLFFRFFRELEGENKAVYDIIVNRWGEFLTIEPNIWGDNPLIVYRITFAKHIQQKMYDYSLEHPELELNISKPNI